MSVPILYVEKPGLATSFQDEGRYGFQRFGVVTSGAMDVQALHIANYLVDNPLHTTCIEICIVGPILTFMNSVSFAITGANLSPSLNGRSIDRYRSYRATKGDTLAFGKQIEGNFAYLSIKGGFDIEEVMGSQSTYSKASIGTIIKKNTMYYSPHPSLLKRNRLFNMLPSFQKDIEVRYIRGPHFDYFEDESAFEKQMYTFIKGDRMGFRFQGLNAIRTFQTHALPSDPIPLGGIQIPPNGQPIILLADRQTTGGYPRIGTVIRKDIPSIVQLPHNGTISFTPITIEEAQKLYTKSSFLFTPHK